MKPFKMRFSMFSISVLLLSNTVTGLVSAQDILTSTPVTYAIATELMKETSITTEYLPPKRYGIERLPNWFATKGTNAVAKAGEQATVAITMRSVWHDDPTYLFARQGNIGLIEIDASQAITPRAQGVAALTLDSGSLSKYVWLNPTNLIRMSAIVADDLKRVWPQHQRVIDTNLQAMTLNVRALISAQQDAIFDIDSVILLSEALEDFASGNQLYVVDRQYAAELEWSDEQKQSLKDQFIKDETLWLMTARKPSQTLLALVPENRILVVDSIDRWGSKGIQTDNPLLRWGLKL
ncbi:ABC transporter substrate-binding protein [uncultured Vibrio sp.]|mgnify:CR=1 FL=1|uniref:ABC transporter substrate-binding protein n=1 Tax=uncultured Vibrio sp. TaxID=114054 RepID=UPI000AC765CC|nr:ABC transporter substrate-binding protein [uncultured Vibrio sp.]